MAKKKMTHQDKPGQNQEQAHQTTAMEDASEKLENLKSLNSMLLRETVERRQQVDSLQQSNGSLESLLTLSRMEKEGLQAELIELSDRTVLLELERVLVFLFVDVQVSEQAEEIEKERDGFGREKGEIEKILGSLEREMRELLREKSEIEKAKSEKESEIGLLKSRLSELVVEIENGKDVSSRVFRERDTMRAELDSQIEETNGLRLKLIETETREGRTQEAVWKLKMEYNGLVEEKEERERRIESMISDKDSIETSLVESNRVINEMKREIEEMIRDKYIIEEERNVQVTKRKELENAVVKLNDMVSSLQRERERLGDTVAALENTCFEGVEKQNQMMLQIGMLVEEKNEMEKGFESLIEEKGLVMKDLDGALKELDDQKLKEGDIIREKIEMEEMKVRKESEIVELHKLVTEYSHVISSLEESCRGQIDKIKQLESEIIRYRDEFNQVTVERDEARKGFDGEKMNGMSLRAKILEMEKNIEEAHRVLWEMKAENCNLIGEKKELESCRAILQKDLASEESKLTEARTQFDDIRAKLGLADANSVLVLNMLRNTAMLVCRSTDERGVMNASMVVDQQKAEEEIKPYVGELEAIKNAFKSRESEVEEMKQQLEFLQNSVAATHKRKNLWTLISSATTILAAASVAYVARGH